MVVVEVKLLQGKVVNVHVPSLESTVSDVTDKVKELLGIVDTNEGDIKVLLYVFMCACGCVCEFLRIRVRITIIVVMFVIICGGSGSQC